MEVKKCSKCGEVKEVSEFYNRSRQCKKCVILKSAEWAKNNREKRLAIMAKYRKNNQDKIKHYNSVVYKERANELSRAKWATDEEFRQRHTARCVDWAKRNREICYQRTRQWRKDNPDKAKILDNKYRHRYSEKIKDRRDKMYKELEDPYIKQLICANTDLSSQDVPSYVIDLKRAQIKHLRMIKELKTIINET